MAKVIEKKTIWATFGAFGIGSAITLLNNLQADAELLGSVPGWLQALITMSAPPAVVFLSSYQAKHTKRPDLGEADDIAVPPAY